MTAPRISLTIDRLVLHGVDRADAAAVQRGLSTALEAMLAGGATALDGSGPAPRLRLQVAPAVNPADLGRSAGRALAAAILGGGRG